jgi:acetyl esterase/lipase
VYKSAVPEHFTEHRLWASQAPLAVGDTPDDIPTLTVFTPEIGATGASVIICPGGGYGHLAEHERTPIAVWLTSLGITAAALKYRLAPRYHHPAPLTDACRAVRYMRAHAQEWKLDPKRVGVIGFSAGGHLAASVSNISLPGTDEIDQQDSRPNLAILCYPVISFTDAIGHLGSRDNLIGKNPTPELVAELSLETRVTHETPPTFLFHTADDPGVKVENSIAYASALRKAKVPFALHIYPHGRHGVGLAADDPMLKTWPSLCADWLRSLKVAAQ